MARLTACFGLSCLDLAGVVIWFCDELFGFKEDTPLAAALMTTMVAAANGNLLHREIAKRSKKQKTISKIEFRIFNETPLYFLNSIFFFVKTLLTIVRLFSDFFPSLCFVKKKNRKKSL